MRVIILVSLSLFGVGYSLPTQQNLTIEESIDNYSDAPEYFLAEYSDLEPEEDYNQLPESKEVDETLDTADSLAFRPLFAYRRKQAEISRRRAYTQRRRYYATRRYYGSSYPNWRCYHGYYPRRTRPYYYYWL